MTAKDVVTGDRTRKPDTVGDTSTVTRKRHSTRRGTRNTPMHACGERKTKNPGHEPRKEFENQFASPKDLVPDLMA